MTHCPQCGGLLCFRTRVAEEIVILDVLADRAPEVADFRRTLKSITHFGDGLRVVVNLSQLKFVTSQLLAGLVALQNELVEMNGRLIVCGARPDQRETLIRMGLGQLFSIFDTESEALKGLRSSAD
jgi:anti-anti-sigma regulatory factor